MTFCIVCFLYVDTEQTSSSENGPARNSFHLSCPLCSNSASNWLFITVPADNRVHILYTEIELVTQMCQFPLFIGKKCTDSWVQIQYLYSHTFSMRPLYTDPGVYVCMFDIVFLCVHVCVCVCAGHGLERKDRLCIPCWRTHLVNSNWMYIGKVGTVFLSIFSRTGVELTIRIGIGSRKKSPYVVISDTCLPLHGSFYIKDVPLKWTYNQYNTHTHTFKYLQSIYQKTKENKHNVICSLGYQ